MAPIPFLGRLHLRQYVALLLSCVLIFAESLISLITIMLPMPIIRFCYRGSRKIFNFLSSPQSRKSRNKKKAIVTSISQAQDFVELCELYGYYAEEHIVQTGDGYLLGLHRLGWKRGENAYRVNSGEDSVKKKVVYLHHGLMMNSDVWVCLTERERCLPFVLAEMGYDVWLGNNRGNKYSKKSINCAPTDLRFWNFSIDEFAFHDIPDSINYILSTTGQPSLSYIGFSQGTAQAFATLSIHPTLNEKVDVFVALAPAMSPKGLTNGIVDSIMKASPDFLFLAFGRRAILGSATMWQAILFPPIFVRFIDISLDFLFGWKANNITPHQKLAAYPHLYSFTSTKSVVHWFQIIRNGTFQMYDDEVQRPLSLSNGGKYYKVAKFPTRNIKTPIVLVYGGSDSLVDIKVMLKELPPHTVAKEVPHFEHLDFLWGSNVDTLVFPHVFEALATYTERDANGKRIRPPMRRVTQIPSTPSAKFPNFSESSPSSESETGEEAINDAAEEAETMPPALQSAETRSLLELHRASPSLGTPSRLSPRFRKSSTKSKSGRFPSRPHSNHSSLFNSSPPGNVSSQITERTSTSRPEGWWSSDEVAETGLSSPDRISPIVNLDGHSPARPRDRTRTRDRSRDHRRKAETAPTQIQSSQDENALQILTPKEMDIPAPVTTTEEEATVQGAEEPPITPSHEHLKKVSSRTSLDSPASETRFGERGITLGVGKAVGGVTGVDALGVRGMGKRRISDK